MPDPNLSSFIWSVADLLRGDYKQSEYGKVILPFTVLRRLDCVLEPTKPAVLAELKKREAAGVNPDPFLLRKANQLFFNTSELDMKKLMGDQDNIGENLRAYMQAFSAPTRRAWRPSPCVTTIPRWDCLVVRVTRTSLRCGVSATLGRLDRNMSEQSQKDLRSKGHGGIVPHIFLLRIDWKMWPL